MPNITVVGSISTDFVVQAARRPKQGETISGTDFSTSFGGKGANQAVAAARLGANVQMIGSVGDDGSGKSLIENLHAFNINTDHVKISESQPSGVALITISDGDNSIIYVPGANKEVIPQNIELAKDIILGSELIITQNEIPQETIEYLIDVCHTNNIKILLNPAPARELSEEYINKIDFLTPNETEFAYIFKGKDLKTMLAKYPNKLIVTIGDKGVVFHNGERMVQVPAIHVEKIVDTTGAGDTFNGAFAFALLSGLPIEKAVEFSNLASSISIQKKGAQTGSPTLKEMKKSEEKDLSIFI